MDSFPHSLTLHYNTWVVFFSNLRLLVGSFPHSLTLFITKLGPALRESQTVTQIASVRIIWNYDREPFDQRSESIFGVKCQCCHNLKLIKHLNKFDLEISQCKIQFLFYENLVTAENVFQIQSKFWGKMLTVAKLLCRTFQKNTTISQLVIPTY